MFTQDEIDAVLNEAQSAVSELAGSVGDLVAQGGARGGQGGTVGDPRGIVGGQGGDQDIGASAVHRGRTAPGSQSAADKLSLERIRRILKLKVPLVVRLAERSMLLSEIMKIMPGTILEFPRTVNEELDLLVNNHQIGQGVAVKVSERFGLRVTYVGDVRRRISSLTAP